MGIEDFNLEPPVAMMIRPICGTYLNLGQFYESKSPNPPSHTHICVLIEKNHGIAA